MSGHESETAEGEQRDRLPDDVVADLLASDRRRALLDCLDETGEPLPMVDLARRTLAREEDAPPYALGEGEVREVRDEVFHEHLPKLTATGVVTYDSLVGTVTLATDDERLLRIDAEERAGEGPGTERKTQ